MSKRQRFLPLGASEFAAILNGEDTNAIQNALRRFVQTVREERRVAVGDSSVDDEKSSESSSSEDEDDEPAQKKQKFRKEETWKEDTANYEVPFVGTSVARGDTGRVVAGEWPTGLLKAYVEKSPRAVEFNHLLPGGPIHKTLLRRKHGRTWHRVQKLYLQAIAELITAAVPLEHIKSEAIPSQRTAAKDSSSCQLVDGLVTSHFSGWCLLLKEETGNGKGKAAVVGGCGQLAQYIIRIFHRLSRINSEKARQIVRDVEQSIAEHVVRFLLKKPNKDWEEYEKSPRAASKIELLEWIGWLASIPDHVLLSRLCSPGARERKISPGLLFMSLKDGFGDFGYESIAHAVELVVRKIRSLLLSEESRSRKILIDLFSRDVVHNVCQISSCAPVLSSQNGLNQVLQSIDKAGNQKEAVGLEARRLLFLLICDPEKSPLIQSIRRNLKSANRARPLILQIVQHFLKSESGEITKLVLRTIRINPSLFASLLQSIPFPDMKKAFAFIARVNLAANIVLHGPSVEECLGKNGSLKKVLDDGTSLQLFLPCNLKDSTVKKALQSGNFLVVAEVLKLVVFVLKRICSYLPTSSGDKNTGLETKRLWNVLKPWIPDPNMLVSLLVKADASRGPSSMFVANRVSVILKVLLERVPEVFSEFTFDWSKLLSRDNGFASARPIVQIGRLETILCMLQANQLRLPPGTEAKFCHDLLHILIHTKIVKLYDSARKATLHFLSTYLGSNDDPGRIPTIANELCCWIDGLCEDTLGDFYSVLQQALHQPYRFTLEFAKVWRNYFGNEVVPRMPFSSLMIQSLRSINKVSSQFVLLYTQVATNSLLFHDNHVALATTIKEVYRQESLAGHSVYINQLDRFISELLLHGKAGSSGQCVALREHLQLLFSEARHPLLRLIKRVEQNEPRERMLLSDDPSPLNWEDLTSLVCQASNSIISHQDGWETISKELKRFLPSLILKSTSTWNICTSLSKQIDYLGVILVSGVSGTADRGVEVDAESIRSVVGGSLTIAGHGTLKDFPEQLYHLYFICPYLPPLLLGELLCQLVEKSQREFLSDPVYCTLTANVLDIAAKALCQLEDDHALCGKVASRLVDLWFSLGNGVDTTEAGALVSSTDNGVFQMVSESNLAASFALCELSKRESTRVVARCLQGEVKDNSKRSQILLTLLEKEPSSYSSAIVKTLRYSEDTSLPRFDELLVAMKSSHLTSDEDKELLLSWQHEALKRLAKYIANAEDSISYDSFERFSGISEEVSDSPALFLALSKIIEKCRSSTKTYKIRLTKLVDAMLRICRTNSGETAQEVASQAFLFLSDQVAQSVRSYMRKLDTPKEDSKSRAAEAIETMITLLTSSVDFNLDYLKRGGKESLTNAVKACLRLGLRPVKGEIYILCAQCLKLVQSYVSAIQSEKLGGVLSKPDDFVCLVFEMASTHSNFHELMRSGTDEVARYELLNLLMVCLGSGENLVFDKEVWQTCLYTFDCGMSPTDLMLRKIIKQYGMLEKEADKPFVTINQFTWGATTASQMQRAESFLNALEMYRIQATLRDFPLHDSIDPFMVETNQDENTRSFTKDDRYSPGFLLPLALSHLELAMDIDHEAILVGTVNITIQAVDLAQRYCERGVTALCFMVLASDCATLRRMGVAILGLLNFLAGSKLALESSTWRSRPQLAMLFDAFRRAMVIFNQEKELAMQCPQVPSLSALFLARASLVLSHPGDDLYANVNRVFLRIDKDHGAFQDLWRLPAFITLFCSAADDHEKLLEERMFALRLVRDGFLDEMCYKPLHACHGIELILSSFDNYRLRSRHDKQDELVVLMEALERIVSFGGTRSKEHLFKRLGLLSFWRSLILARSFTGFVHTSKERDSFLSCLRACLSHASSVMTKDDFSLATEGLWQPLLDFFLELKASDGSLAYPCLSTLNALRYPLVDDVTVIPPISSSDGVVFSTATTLLTVCDELGESPFSMILCVLPLCSSNQTTDEEYAANFCLGLLRLAMQKDMDLPCILLRIASVIQWFDSSTFDRNDELLKALLKFRCELCFNEGVLSKWRICISALIKSPPDDDNGHGTSALRRITQELLQLNP